MNDSSPSTGSGESAAGGAPPPASCNAARWSKDAPLVAPATQPASSTAAVAGLTATSPAPAADSSLIVSVAAGPVTTSSRWLESTRKKWHGPE